VITCAKAGWKRNKTGVDSMTEAVRMAVKEMKDDDITVVHCCDNTAFMARSEEGGDVPIRKTNNKWHVEGELVVAGKDRLFLFFKNMLPVLKELEGRKVIFLTPMPRYVYETCCTQLDHNTTFQEAEFKEGVLKSLADARNYYKDFLFTSNLRGFTVLNPGLCVPREEEDGEPLWGKDPVHPLKSGYLRIADMIVQEAGKLRGRGKKRAGGQIEREAKKPRMEYQRPLWVNESSPAVAGSSQDGGYRGQYQGRFGGRLGRAGQGYRPRYRGPRGGGGWIRGQGRF